MQQPSAQGIASLYRGNPQPLQQSIQKEQQAKPGLPPDLQKMLALQIVTNEKDSATAQKAMEQLQQMGGPQGNPPTVMQSLQQQAEQKMQAQAQQASQQPEMQPQAQGIDQSDRVAFAGAEGGIVAFANEGEVPEAKKYETPYDRRNREIREAEAKNRGSDEPLDAQAAADRNALKRILAAIKGTSEDAGRAIADVATVVPRSLASAYDTVAVRPMRAAGINAAYLAPKLTPEGASTGSATPFSDIKTAREAAKNTPSVDNQSAAETARLQRQRSLPQAPAPAPVRDLKALADQQNRVNRPAAPKPEAPVAAPTFAAPVEDSDAMKLQKARLNASPEAKRAADVAEYKKMIGEPDTTQHDRLIAELEKRKSQLEGPQDSYGQLMEYLGQISANSKPGRGSFASGAAGARGVDQLNKERQLQQFDLSKQAIEVSQKKLDTVRAYAKDVYGVGKAAFDQVYKDQFDAAKEIVKDESAARQLANQNTLKMFELDQNKMLRREEMKKDLQVANINASSRTGAGGGGDKQQLAELKALQTSLKDQLKDPAMMGKAGAPLRAQLAQVNAAVAQMAGLDTMGAAPGAPKGPGGTNQQGWSIKPLQ
jgi:hypothetical protein